jgi:DNA (cytosine-5)-methyltransferase 1
MPSKSYSVVDLFCGAGGLSSGLGWAGFDVIWATDSDKKAVKTYSENHPDVRTTMKDIASIQPPGVHAAGGLDLLAGGPPCPTFSKVGRAKLNSLEESDPATDSRHQLWQHFLRFASHYRPRVLLMENVPGMATATNEAGEAVLSIILDEIRSLGYRVQASVIDAAGYGVPQHRERLFIIGNRLDVPNPELINWRTHREPRTQDECQAEMVSAQGPQSFQQTLDEILESDDENDSESQNTPGYRRPYVTMGAAILDLPPLSPAGDEVNREGTHPPVKADHYEIPAVTEYQQWARNIPEEKSWKDVPLSNHESRFHNVSDLSIYKLLGPSTGWRIGDLPDELQPYRSDVFADNYTKQDPTRPSSTIPAHLHKDGHMHIHPSEARSFTVREAARLQSFRDTYRFPVSRTAAFKQVGNAVPPLLAESIGNAIMSILKDS